MTADEDLISLDHAAEPVYGFQMKGPIALRTHGPDKCEGQVCCIHAPSDHHMVTWRQNWRGDRSLMERMCPHGVGHPDPDDIAYKRRVRGERFAYYEGVHGCDGCCATSVAGEAVGDYERPVGCTCDIDDDDPQMLLDDPACPVHRDEARDAS